MKISPGDLDAVAGKIVALIDLGKIADALGVISSNKDLEDRFSFEHAYCLYREGRLDESLIRLAKVPEEKRADRLRLEGQLRFRLEEYEKCIEVYSELFKSHEESSLEARTNVIAAYIAANRSNEVASVLDAMRITPNEGLELAFNVSCALLDEGLYDEAREQLLAAHRIGEEVLFDEGLDDEEVAAELAAVDAQMAYLDAVEGKIKEAAESLKSVLDLESPDEQANISAAANLCLTQVAFYPADRKGAQEKLHTLEPFLERSGGFLRIKPSLERRLGSTSSQAVLGVYACTCLSAHKNEHAREAVRSLDKLYPGTALGAMMHAAILARDGKIKEALAALETGSSRIKGSKYEFPSVAMGSQLAVHLNDYDKASQLLASLPSEFAKKPAIIATSANLMELKGDASGARNIALNVLNSLAGNESKKWALNKLSALDLSSGKITSAVDHLVEYTKVDAAAWNEPRILHLLPRCIATCDPERCLEVLSNLEPGHTSLDASKVDALEAQGGAALSSKSPMQDKQGTLDFQLAENKKIERKRKRKPRYPKGFDPVNPGPPPDPERWLPKWQRAENKKLRKKRKEKVRDSLNRFACTSRKTKSLSNNSVHLIESYVFHRKLSEEAKEQEKWMRPSTVPSPQNLKQRLRAILLLPPPNRTRRRRRRERDKAKEHYISKPHCKNLSIKNTPNTIILVNHEPQLGGAFAGGTEYPAPPGCVPGICPPCWLRPFRGTIPGAFSAGWGGGGTFTTPSIASTPTGLDGRKLFAISIFKRTGSWGSCAITPPNESIACRICSMLSLNCTSNCVFSCTLKEAIFVRN